jgi:molybdopterin-guanine dinucleotide biosynthesis protein A
MKDTIGAVIAGGASSRYGSPKALVTIGGVRVVDRVIAALRMVCKDVIAIVNDSELARAIGLPHRADVLQNAGALAGVHAALLHARDAGSAGVLAAACDMPFLNGDLLREIASRSGHADVVVPESEGRRGIEPLCAWYSTSCIDPIEATIARGDARMIGFHNDVTVARVPLARVRELGDASVMFRNLNTPEDREIAERLLTERVA